jgi:hypothetical protein
MEEVGLVDVDMAAKVACARGSVVMDDCHGHCSFVVSFVQVLLFVGDVVVWGGKGIGSEMGYYDFVDFFAVVAILRGMLEWRLDDL